MNNKVFSSHSLRKYRVQLVGVIRQEKPTQNYHGHNSKPGKTTHVFSSYFCPPFVDCHLTFCLSLCVTLKGHSGKKIIMLQNFRNTHQSTMKMFQEACNAYFLQRIGNVCIKFSPWTVGLSYLYGCECNGWTAPP